MKIHIEATKRIKDKLKNYDGLYHSILKSLEDAQNVLDMRYEIVVDLQQHGIINDCRISTVVDFIENGKYE